MPDELIRSVFAKKPKEVLFPAIEQSEVEQDQDLDAWADLHEHPTSPLTMLVGDGRAIPGRYCEPCGILRMAKYEPPFYEVPKRLVETWQTWVDVTTMVAAALAVALLSR